MGWGKYSGPYLVSENNKGHVQARKSLMAMEVKRQHRSGYVSNVDMKLYVNGKQVSEHGKVAEAK